MRPWGWVFRMLGFESQHQPPDLSQHQSDLAENQRRQAEITASMRVVETERRMAENRIRRGR